MQRAKRLKLEHIAECCHEANRALCEMQNDNSQTDWYHAPEWQKQSAMEGVEYALHNPNATPKSMHEQWFKMKEKEGWVYGEVKDPEAKTHPCMVPYSELPKEQQIKDTVFICTVHSQDRMYDDERPGR